MKEYIAELSAGIEAILTRILSHAYDENNAIDAGPAHKAEQVQLMLDSLTAEEVRAMLIDLNERASALPVAA